MSVQILISRLEGQNAYLRRENTLLKEKNQHMRNQIQQTSKLTPTVQQLLAIVNQLERDNQVIRGQMRQMVAVVVEMEAQINEKQAHRQEIKTKMFQNQQYWAIKLEEASQQWRLRAKKQQDTILGTMKEQITALKNEITLKDCLLKDKQAEIQRILLRFQKCINS